MILKKKHLYILFIIFSYNNIFASIPSNSNSKYQAFINNLAQLSGYSYMNVKITPSDDVKENGALATCSNQNTVLYYPPFLEDVYNNGFGFGETSINNTNSRNLNWQQSGVLAHELGHIILNHCDKYLINGKRKQAEIEADIFMGRILHLLGATLAQAQSCLYLPIVKEEETGKYPSRNGRLNNVKKGWDSYIPKNNINIEKELVKARLLFLRDKVVDAFNIYKNFENNASLDKQDLYILGFCYNFGYGTYTDIAKAKKYFLKCYTDYKMVDAAAQLLSIESDNENYYKAIEYGHFVLNNSKRIDNTQKENKEEILEMRHIALVENNLGSAYYMVGNKQQALKYFKLSVDKQFCMAQMSLTSYYYQESNYKLALFWIDQFLLQGLNALDIIDLGGQSEADKLINNAKQLKKQLTNEIKKQ